MHCCTDPAMIKGRLECRHYGKQTRQNKRDLGKYHRKAEAIQQQAIESQLLHCMPPCTTGPNAHKHWTHPTGTEDCLKLLVRFRMNTKTNTCSLLITVVFTTGLTIWKGLLGTFERDMFDHLKWTENYIHSLYHAGQTCITHVLEAQAICPGNISVCHHYSTKYCVPSVYLILLIKLPLLFIFYTIPVSKFTMCYRQDSYQFLF